MSANPSPCFVSSLPEVFVSIEQITRPIENKLGPKKNVCVFTVTCQKNLRSVGINFFIYLLSTKPEIVVPNSGI